MRLAFFVPGIPIPKGSMRAFLPRGHTRPVVTADNARTKPWQRAIAINAIRAKGEEPACQGRVSVSRTFYLPRPKSAPKAQTAATKRPDLDKLARCALDALTLAHCYDDDSQVVELTAHKYYAFPGGPEPGVLVEVVG